jgi:hypothetical protein
MLTKSNALGFAVLSLVVNELSEAEFKEVHIEPYLNGRENGFSTHFYLRNNRFDRKFVFSEARRSDYIVVYESTSNGFDMLGNGVSDEIYNAGRYFPDAEQAAEYIVDRMREIDPNA